MPLRDPEDRKPFAEMLSAVNAVLSPGSRELTKPVIEIYWNALAAYDLAAVRVAFDRHVKSPDTGQFMPKPADLIRMIGGTSADSAMRAWSKVERALRLVGGYQSVVFDDPVIHRCIDDMGGWSKLCATDVGELAFRARDFQALYRGFAMRREVPQCPPYLIGRFEAENRSAGRQVEPPILVGDTHKCELVLSGVGKELLSIE